MTNEELMKIYWIILAVFSVLLISYFGHKIYLIKHSDSTKSAAAKVFRLHGGIRDWKTISDVTLGEGADAVVADQLVIGPFGVIVACDLYQKGNVYGDLTAAEWIIAQGEEADEKKYRIPSPYHQAQLFVEQLRRVFAENKIYSVPVEIMIPKTQKQGSYITGSSQYLFDMRELKAQLEKARFDKDNGVDVEACAALLKH